MNKFDRVISTMTLLQTRSVVKANDISERFDVSLRTVYRDINTLKNAGIPIIGDPGVGYSIMEGYRLPPIMFNEGEAAALLTAEKFIGKLTDSQTEAFYSTAMVKIKAILRSSEKQSLEILDDSISISEQNIGQNKTFLQDIFMGIATKAILSIEYKKADGSYSDRKLEPIGCYHKYDNWYLVAYCQSKQDYRIFKVKRILNLKVFGQRFTTKHITLQKFIEEQEVSWQAEQNFQYIDILFNHSVVEYADKRKYYFGFIKEQETSEGVRMQFLNSSIEIIARWLLQFSNQVTVYASDELLAKMKVLSKEISTHYN